MTLSERLLTIASLVKQGSVVADIGADHGQLSIYLVENNICSKVFAVENKEGPYTILKTNTRRYPEITVSFSDGISEVPDDVDTLVIAGMGGRLISSILLENKEKLNHIKYIIIDAHRDLEFVRQTLLDLGYEFEKEILVLGSVFYNVISVSKGSKKLKPADLEFGFNISKDPLFEKYRERLLKQFERNYQSNNSLELKEKIERLKQL